MEDKGEIALRKLEQTKKEIDIKIDTYFKQLDSLFKLLFTLVYETRLVSAIAVKDSTITRYFLADKGVTNSQDYINYCSEHPMAKNYNEEIKLSQEILNDISSDAYKNPKNFLFMESKKQFREVEMNQIIVNRMKLMIKRLENLDGQENSIEELKKEIELTEKHIKKLFDEKIKLNKREDKDMITKKTEADKIIKDYLDKNKEGFIERYRYLPIYDITTHLEPYIKQLYWEAKELYWLGKYNACIIICCVVIEAILKDVIRTKEKKQSVKIDFEDVINHCKTKDYIDEIDKVWLVYVKDRFRNPYIHSRLEDIIPLIITPGVSIGGFNPDVQMISAKTMPVLRDIMKPDFDKEESLKLFKETHKFIKKISEKHFNYYNKNEKNEKK